MAAERLQGEALENALLETLQAIALYGSRETPQADMFGGAPVSVRDRLEAIKLLCKITGLIDQSRNKALAEGAKKVDGVTPSTITRIRELLGAGG